eukprot:2460097-Pyramimonas_sp.AAC.1
MAPSERWRRAEVIRWLTCPPQTRRGLRAAAGTDLHCSGALRCACGVPTPRAAMAHWRRSSP